jgi:hypothetical protein
MFADVARWRIGKRRAQMQAKLVTEEIEIHPRIG